MTCLCRREPTLMSVTKEIHVGLTKNVAVREQLCQFAVSDRGAMIGVYNSVQSCVVKIKSVASRIDDDWHTLLRSEVTTAGCVPSAFSFNTFYRAMLCIARTVLSPDVRLSVCLSQLLRQLNISSNFSYRRVVTPL